MRNHHLPIFRLELSDTGHFVVISVRSPLLETRKNGNSMGQSQAALRVSTLVVDSNVERIQKINGALHNRTEFVHVGSALTARSAQQLMTSHTPDLLFLNIDLPDKSGLELWRSIPEADRPWTIVMSADEQSISRLLDTSFLDFLSLPMDQERLDRSLEKVLKVAHFSPSHCNDNANGHRPSRIAVKTGSRIIFLPTGDIESITGSGYYIELHTRAKKYLVRQSLGEIIESLPMHKFRRVHRSAIVNLDHIREILKKGPKAYYAKMESEKLVRISSTYRKELFDALML